MPQLIRFHTVLIRLRTQMPTRAEWQDYRRLGREVLLVTASFMVLGLILGLAADVLPMLLPL